MTKQDIICGNNASAIIPSGHDAHTAIFSQVDASFFNNYKAKLEEAGYRLYSESEFSGESDERVNLFATYESDTETVDLGHHAYADRMYVTYTPKKEGWVLPQKDAPEYTALGDNYPTILTQPGTERFHTAAASMCYIMRVADGSFVIIDSDFCEPMADLLYKLLKKQAPDPDNIVISAWMFTHPHSDHVGGFIEFSKKYASDPSFTLKQVVYNFSSDEYISEWEAYLQKETFIAAKRFGDNVTFVRPHAGNILRYCDLTFRVLYTQEEYLAVSGKVVGSNNASIVTQMETASGVKVLFGADHAVRGNYNGELFCEGAIYRWYGNFIESDVLTMFHHGFGGGADHHVYGKIKPKIIFWPCAVNRIYNGDNGQPYARPLTEGTANKYFTDPEQAKKNGVLGYYISGDALQILDLSNTNLNVTEYEACEDYVR